MSRGRIVLGWVPPAAVIAVAVAIGGGLDPWHRLVLTTLVLYVALKATAIVTRRSSLVGTNAVGRTLFWTVWPGFDATPFAERRQARTVDVHGPIAQGATLMFLGMSALGALAVLEGSIGDTVLGWLGIGALLLTVHFGYSDVLTGLMRRAGFPVRRLFDDPLKSRTLGEFWSRRWNVAFVEMDRALFLPLFRSWLGKRVAVFGVFALSGVLHELAISYPAGGGWGLPLVYFGIEGLLTAVERPLHIRRWPHLAARAWTIVGVLAPLPLLFNTSFRTELVVPLIRNLGDIAPAPATAFDVLLWVAGGGNLLLLAVSYQVPRRLGWHEDLASLSPFNSKLLWTFGGFIIFTYLSIGIMTLALHDDLLAGERAAVAIALFGGLYWLSRLFTDLVVWRDEDWPPGELVFVGHVMLNGLFSMMTGIYLTFVAWQWLV